MQEANVIDTYCFRLKLTELCAAVRKAERSGNDTQADALYSDLAEHYDRACQEILELTNHA